MENLGESGALTILLRRWSGGDEAALQEITPLVYQTLRGLADSYLRRERPDHTLQPTALVHEAYLRLVDQNQAFESRRQFYGVAAHLMRMILVDHARAHGSVKRGRGAVRIPLDELDIPGREPEVDVLALDEALERLAALDERKSRAIELRYFAGLGVEETAASLKISVATVRRELRFAENWLCRELTK
jgi:RNA polymerase sigma factor (TIGR02999 family)